MCGRGAKCFGREHLEGRGNGVDQLVEEAGRGVFRLAGWNEGEMLPASLVVVVLAFECGFVEWVVVEWDG